jgi:hypothetical protein
MAPSHLCWHACPHYYKLVIGPLLPFSVEPPVRSHVRAGRTAPAPPPPRDTTGPAPCAAQILRGEQASSRSLLCVSYVYVCFVWSLCDVRRTFLSSRAARFATAIRFSSARFLWYVKDQASISINRDQSTSLVLRFLLTLPGQCGRGRPDTLSRPRRRAG